jgi:hypothetical protein
MNKPNVFYVSILMLSILLIISCGKKEPPEPGRYYNKAHKFSIKMPNIWQFKENHLGAAVVAFSPQDGPDDKFFENVSISVERLGLDISSEEFAQDNLARMDMYLKDFVKLDSGTAIIDNRETHWSIYTHHNGPEPVKAITYSFAYKKRGYLITGAAAPDQFDKYKGAFNLITGSFKLE